MGKTNYYNKKAKRVPYSDANSIQQLRATNALLKFCLEHNYPDKSPALKSIELCAKALESKDIKTAVEHYLDVPLGGNGCFNDWWPPTVYENETESYTWAVFEALVSFWSHNMRLSVET